MWVNFICLSLNVKKCKESRQISLFDSRSFPKRNWLQTQATRNVFLTFTDDWSPSVRLTAITSFAAQLSGAFLCLLQIQLNYRNSLLVFSRTLKLSKYSFALVSKIIFAKDQSVRKTHGMHALYLKTVELFLWSNTESRGLKTSSPPVPL